MNVFITKKIMPLASQLLEEAGIKVTQWDERKPLSKEELITHCKQHDALLCIGSHHIDAHFLNACSHLKVIALHAVGYDNVDMKEATRLKIPIGNTPGVLSAATADTAFLLMLAVSRKAFYLYDSIRRGEWNANSFNQNLGIELYGKTIGIFGLGKIGFEMAKRCRLMFNMKVIYYNRGHNTEAEKELGASRVSFDELLKQSDVISVHSNLSAETKELFNKSVFEKMNPTSIFINTARGGIHNETDLIEALKNNTIWGAGLDVTNPEPMQKDNTLLTMPNVCVLPHIGSATRETREAMVKLAAENIIAGLKNEKLPHCVNEEIYD
jgi:glyoxylate reductase